jgi:hypothetical protein
VIEAPKQKSDNTAAGNNHRRMKGRRLACQGYSRKPNEHDVCHKYAPDDLID